jgi:hypothetical protein
MLAQKYGEGRESVQTQFEELQSEFDDKVKKLQTICDHSMSRWKKSYYGESTVSKSPKGKNIYMPVKSITFYYCPNCKVITKQIDHIKEAGIEGPAVFLLRGESW